MRRLAGLLLLGWAAWLSAADVAQTTQSAYTAFLEGRYDDAASAYRYLAELGIGGYETEASLAVLARDSGHPDAALPLWLKATLDSDAHGLVWNERAWAYLAEGRGKEARDAFLHAIDRSTTTATQAEANLGLGLAALQRSDPKEGMDPLRSALVQGPYAMPAASYETALTALALGDKPAALEYLRQGLQVDPMHMESLRLLARLYLKVGDNRPAWQAYARIAAYDPKDEEAAGALKKLSRYITGDPETSIAVRRLARPLLDPSADPAVPPAPSTPTLRVALFSNTRTGQPATLTRVYFMANAPFRVIAASGDVIKEDGGAYDQWEVDFRTESDLVELRDASRNIVYTSKTPFRIVPQPRAGTVLLKSGQFQELTGFDRGDRELRGVVEIRPTPNGFKAVNEVALEDYLYGAVGAAMPQGSPSEAYKAQAVVSRSLALWYKSQAPPNLEKTDLCDSAYCQAYVGVNEEMREASKAVAATEGLVLTTKDGRLARAMQHEHCGGFTESGAATGDASLASLASVSDGPGGAPPSTPVQLERFTHEFPSPDRYCELQTVTSPASSRWIRLLDVKELALRAARVKNIGTIRRIYAGRRSATGRVQTLMVEGSRGQLQLDGADAIGDFLSPGTLRSTLFTIQPILGASGPVQFLVFGAGTGSGLGLCRAGAIGQAATGRKFADILRVYFPSYGLESPRDKPKTAERPRYRRPLNPHYKKPGG